MLYKKVCPIDSKVFYARKLNTIFCSKRCANRTRYMPAKLVANLIAGVSRYMFDEKEYQRMTLDEDNIATEESTVSQKQIEDLETIARVKKYEQNQKEEKEKQKSMKSSSGFTEVIDATVHVTTENDLTLSSIKTMVEVIKDNPDIVNKEPKKYKIKSLQRNGG